MIRVVIVDDHHLVRQGIRALLEKAGDIEVIGEGADGQEALALVERLRPDVAVMDIAMPRLNGTQAIERIRTLDVPTRVVVLSMYSEPALVRQALRSGARGYILKRSVAEELLQAIRAANRGEIYLSPAVSEAIVSRLLLGHRYNHAEDTTAFDSLSPREREVLQLVAEGNTNKAIARIISVSVKTVEKHRASLMSKLDVHDTAGLVRFAIKHGLVFLEG